MRIEELLQEQLGQVPGNGGRVYPVKLPQSPALPATVYRRLESGLVRLIDGTYSTFRKPLFEITTWAATYSEAKTIADETRRVTALLAGTVREEIRVQRVLMEDEEQDDYDDETRNYSVTQTLKIHHSIDTV